MFEINGKKYCKFIVKPQSPNEWIKKHIYIVFSLQYSNKVKVFNFQYSQLIPGELGQSFETGPEHGRCPESHGGTLGLQNEAKVGLDKGDHPEEGADVNREDHPRGRGVLVVGHVDRETLPDGDLKQKHQIMAISGSLVIIRC